MYKNIKLKVYQLARPRTETRSRHHNQAHELTYRTYTYTVVNTQFLIGISTEHNNTMNFKK